MIELCDLFCDEVELFKLSYHHVEGIVFAADVHGVDEFDDGIGASDEILDIVLFYQGNLLEGYLVCKHRFLSVFAEVYLIYRGLFCYLLERLRLCYRLLSIYNSGV